MREDIEASQEPVMTRHVHSFPLVRATSRHGSPEPPGQEEPQHTQRTLTCQRQTVGVLGPAVLEQLLLNRMFQLISNGIGSLLPTSPPLRPFLPPPLPLSQQILPENYKA